MKPEYKHPAGNMRCRSKRIALSEALHTPSAGNTFSGRVCSDHEQSAAVSPRYDLGVAWDKPVYGKIGASKALSILGAEWFAEVTAVKMPGKVVWCDFELARAFGFDVSSSNCMTPELHEQLIDALSYRIPPQGEKTDERETVTVYADRYGGAGVAPALGAGRAGFLLYGNLYLKGIGHTPLFKHDDPDDFSCSHGGLLTSDGMIEAVFGQVNANLFSKGSTQILAIVDQAEHIDYPGRRKKARAIAVRAGSQLRPAHLLARRAQGTRTLLELFSDMTRETGQLSTRRNELSDEEVTDVKATMLHVIDDHALVTAEQFRWRIIHGALSSSNMELSGAMLDLVTEAAQPRTAPLWTLEYPDSVFGREHIERAVQLSAVYRKLVSSIPQHQRKLFNARTIDFRKEVERFYRRHLQAQILSATGLKPEVAERIRADHADLASHFQDLFMEMAQLNNPGSRSMRGPSFESISVLDVFHLLRTYPERFFADPEADHRKYIRAKLKPIFRGNKFQIAGNRVRVAGLIKAFARLYGELMSACESVAEEYYGDAASMRASIIARAAFENEPLSFLSYKRLHEELEEVVRAYTAGGNTDLLREAIDKRVAASLRNTDALLAQGTSGQMTDGGFELESRTIEGVNYSVRAWDDATQTRRLHVCIPVRRGSDYHVPAFTEHAALTARQLRSIYFRFTSDGGASMAELRGRLKRDEKLGLVIEFADIHTERRVGRLEGSFHLGGPGRLACLKDTSRSGGYAFALPDKRELYKMMRRGILNSSSGSERTAGAPTYTRRRKDVNPPVVV